MTTDYETAKALFVEQDAAAGMQAFMTGKITVQGDMMKLMAMQTAMPTDEASRQIADEIKAITELARARSDVTRRRRSTTSAVTQSRRGARRSGHDVRRGRRIVDADSHLMEWPGFLADHADPAFRDDAAADRRRAVRAHADRRRPRPPASATALIALGDDLVRKGPKWHAALGAVDPAERSHRPRPARLRAPGRVLVAVRAAVRHRRSRPALRRLPRPQPRRRRVLRRRSRGCSASACATSTTSTGRSPSSTSPSTSGCARSGCRPARPAGGRPGHVDHDPFWARLAERGVPFVLHVGSGPLGIGDAWLDNGRPPAEEMTGAEIIGSKDFMVVYQTAERFLSVLVLDGVLERHPTLHGGAIEMGAGWVPAMLRRLDHAVADLAALRAAPRHVRRARRPSRRPPSCASRRTRSRTSAGCAPSPTRRCTCSRRTTRTPRAAAIRSAASTARSPTPTAATLDGFFAANAASWLALA